MQEKTFIKGTSDVAVGVTTKGDFSFTPTSSPSRYIIFVNDRDYEIKKDSWFALEKGDKITYNKGSLGGIRNIRVKDREDNRDE